LDYSEGQQVARRRESGVDRIGPYSLIAQIAGGEFTTVHLAQRQGTLGYQRLTAIKRLRPALSRQPEWTQLLLDEARLSAGVRHGNIVDIIDVGTDPSSGVYLVMGYVEGADLEVLIARAGKERHPRYLVPPIVDALNGLAAVHTALDELGESLSMVHQAPRARHILIGIDGTARITDFSQVSARGLIPSTLRGKRLAAGYMAPEQVSVSEPVSARTDLFIVGITLWETLTGERLFDAENPALARRAILERHIPRPSEVGLRPPACFDAICMKALQRNPEQRYQTAHEMARELREAAVSESLYASASELGQWVRALASRALVERRRAIGAEEPSQEISLEELDAREPTSVITTGPTAGETPDRSSSAAAAADVSARAVEPPASSPPVSPPVSKAGAATAALAIARGVSAAGPRSKFATTMMETRVGHPFAGELGPRAEELRAASAGEAKRSDEPRAVTARALDAESAAVAQAITQAITMDPAPLADDPSRVARSMTVPVYGPASAPRAAPVGLPAPTATLLGVSSQVRGQATPPPGLSAPRRNLTPSVRPTTEGAVVAGAAPAGASPSPASASLSGARVEDPRAATTVPFKRKSMPTASFFGAALLDGLTSPDGSSPSGSSPSASPSSAPPSSAPLFSAPASSSPPAADALVTPPRKPRKLSSSATLPEGTVLSTYLPEEQSFSPSAGARSEARAVDGPAEFSARAHDGAHGAASETPAFTGFGYSAPSAGAELPHDDLFASRPEERVAPQQGGYRDGPSEPQRTFDGELPADIFARLQAARREATESFRPPSFAVQDHAWTEREPTGGFGLKSLLVAAAIVATGVFGYRQWGEEQLPVRSAAAPTDQAGPAPALPGSEPLPTSRPFDELPGAAPLEPSATVTPRDEPVPPPLEVVPPPYGREVPPPFVAPVEAPAAPAADSAPRRIATAVKRSPRPAASLYSEPSPPPQLAPRPARRPARAVDPGLPANPY